MSAGRIRNADMRSQGSGEPRSKARTSRARSSPRDIGARDRPATARAQGLSSNCRAIGPAGSIAAGFAHRSIKTTRTRRRLHQLAPMVALMTLGVPKAAPTLAMYKLEASSPRPNAMLAG
jgi:hypothetical protein